MRSRRPWPATSHWRTERGAERRGNRRSSTGCQGRPSQTRRGEVSYPPRPTSTSSLQYGALHFRRFRAAPRRLRIAALPTFSFFPSHDQPPSSKVTTPASAPSLTPSLSLFFLLFSVIFRLPDFSFVLSSDLSLFLSLSFSSFFPF